MISAACSGSAIRTCSCVRAVHRTRLRRSRSTLIYFLLARGERSHWHRIDAVETWHYYAGAPLTLRMADDEGQRSVTLGADLATGEQPQAIVPPHAWQSAESNGDWTLVGCTVAPGFEFATFELGPDGWEPTS